jgi:hypothetical protein
MGRFGGRTRVSPDSDEEQGRARRRGEYLDDDKLAEAELADAKPRLRSVITGGAGAMQEQGSHRQWKDYGRESSRRRPEESGMPDTQVAPWEVPRGRHWGVRITHC